MVSFEKLLWVNVWSRSPLPSRRLYLKICTAVLLNFVYFNLNSIAITCVQQYSYKTHYSDNLTKIESTLRAVQVQVNLSSVFIWCDWFLGDYFVLIYFFLNNKLNKLFKWPVINRILCSLFIHVHLIRSRIRVW